jgi:hypothetical protein
MIAVIGIPPNDRFNQGSKRCEQDICGAAEAVRRRR